MSKSTHKAAVVDLSDYAKHINAPEDHPLFDDAVESARAGALRAAYVMIWLACAESLKRRFREAQKRDGTAGIIVGEIEVKEREHKAVDKFVLEKAREYGFVSDSGHTILNHIYEMRCLYGHPYEEAPSQEQVSHAAAVVVEHLLSKPVKLRHGFGSQLLKSLLENRTYLDDQQTAVVAFAKDILPRLDESIYGWFLDTYWKALEPLWDDSSMSIFFWRGTWFCRSMLTQVGINVFSLDEWHDRSNMFPKTLLRVCTVADVFTGIGERAQNSLVGSIISESSTRPSVLKYFERLNNGNALSKRQQERFDEHLAGTTATSLRSAGLSTKTCYGNLIAAMKSSNWYKQNPAIDLIFSNGPDQANDLNSDQQVDLGRNILQSAQGSAGSANIFLEKLAAGGVSWPYDFIRGIALEAFTNERNEIRFKHRHLDKVLSTIIHLEKMKRKQLVSEIASSIDASVPQKRLDREDFDDVIESLQSYRWAAPLIASLQTKAASLPVEENE